MEPITLQQNARESASSSASRGPRRGGPNAFPSSSQGLAYTIHHPNACPNNPEDPFGIFEALKGGENTVPQQPKACSNDLKNGSDSF